MRQDVSFAREHCFLFSHALQREVVGQSTYSREPALALAGLNNDLKNRTIQRVGNSVFCFLTSLECHSSGRSRHVRTSNQVALLKNCMLRGFCLQSHSAFKLAFHSICDSTVTKHCYRVGIVFLFFFSFFQEPSSDTSAHTNIK